MLGALDGPSKLYHPYSDSVAKLYVLRVCVCVFVNAICLKRFRCHQKIVMGARCGQKLGRLQKNGCILKHRSKQTVIKRHLWCSSSSGIISSVFWLLQYSLAQPRMYTNVLNTGEYVNFVIFDQCLATCEKRQKIRPRLLWNSNKKSYALYRTVTFPMTLSEPCYCACAYTAHVQSLSDSRDSCSKRNHGQYPARPLSRQCEIPWRFVALLSMLSVTDIMPVLVLLSVVASGGRNATVHDQKSKRNAQVQQSQEWMQICS